MSKALARVLALYFPFILIPSSRITCYPMAGRALLLLTLFLRQPYRGRAVLKVLASPSYTRGDELHSSLTKTLRASTFSTAAIG
jgi:hypothetical protein